MASRIRPGHSRPRAAHADRDQQVALPNDPARASDMRSFVAQFMGRVRVPEEVADEVLMAVGEVVANACRHGRRTNGRGKVNLRCELTELQLAVTVTDDGPGFDVDSVFVEGRPDLLAQGGRGFFLMRQLMDRVDVDSSAGGTTVVLERDLPR